jgi:hypothetical protein
MEKLKEKAYIDIIVRGTGRFYIFRERGGGVEFWDQKLKNPGIFFWANPD